MRRPTEPGVSSKSAGSSYAPRTPADSSRHNNHNTSNHQQLFDPEKARPRIVLRSPGARKPAPKSCLATMLLYPPLPHMPSLLFLTDGTHGSSSLTTAAVSGGFWSSPVGSMLMYACGSTASISFTKVCVSLFVPFTGRPFF